MLVHADQIKAGQTLPSVSKQPVSRVVVTADGYVRVQYANTTYMSWFVRDQKTMLYPLVEVSG